MFDPNDAALVDTIMTMARHIGLDIVAEGVETTAQLDALKELACDCYQGFLTAKPMQPDAATEFLRENRKTTTIESV